MVDYSRLWEPLRDEEKEDGLRFAGHVGQTLSAWSDIEYQLCICFAHAINPDDFTPAASSFWAIASFDGKLKLTDVAVRASLTQLNRGGPRGAVEYPGNPELERRWVGLERRTAKASRPRNELAHGVIKYRRDFDKDEAPVATYFIEPHAGANLYNIARDRAKQKQYVQADIKRIRSQFTELHQDLSIFAEDLRVERQTLFRALVKANVVEEDVQPAVYPRN